MPEITDGCRKAAEEILDRCFKVERIGPGGPWEEEIQIAACIIARHTRAKEMVDLLREMESAEDAHANCEECNGEGIPELCAKCFPLFDAARLKRRAILTEVDREGEGGK